VWNQNQHQNQQRPGPGGELSPPRAALIWLFMILGMFLLVAYSNVLTGSSRSAPLSYSRFREVVRDGKVARVVVTDSRIVGEWRPDARPADKPKIFVVTRPVGDVEGSLMEFLATYHVDAEAKQPSQLLNLLSFVAVLVISLLVVGMVMRRANPAERAMAFGKSRARQYVERDVKTTFDDVAGIDEPKAELLEIVDYLRAPERFRRLGGRIPRGVLLVGAPGTGKTLLAKAVAGEAQVPFFSMSGSDFVELFVGVGASRVRDLFRQAEQQSPCIVFIDELDALGKARGASLVGGGHDEREQTLNQLLVEMDGFDSSVNIILMAATNRPEILDPALLRPGRFDRQVFIPPPDIHGREQILAVHVAKIILAPEVDLHRVAARTPGFVGADLENVVNEAALLAARRNRDAVQFEDFDEAIDRVSIGLERKSQVMSEQEKQGTAYHEAGHAIAALFTPHADPVHKVSIIPRGLTGGVTVFTRDEERHFHTASHLRAALVTALGGRAAEEVVFGEVTTGTYDDIRKVTRLARAMVTEYGMSDELGPLNYESGVRPDAFGFATPAGSGQLSDETAQRVDAEVRRIVDTAYDQARATLREHREQLEHLAQRLLEVETVDREELYALVGLTDGAPAPR
jgi:cell division protease FtsH